MKNAGRAALDGGAIAIALPLVLALAGFCLPACSSTTSVDSGPSCTNGTKDDGEEGVDCGGVCPVKCTGATCATPPCLEGQGCIDSTDCIGTCTAGICGPISHTDGKKNLDETDVDCGGPTAPKCPDGKACGADTDCATGYCPVDTKTCTAPTYSDGVKNGTETDVDCGGSGMGFKACATGLSCVVDTDCNGACTYKKKCIDMPSCKNQHGGDTCGTNEVGSGAETHLGPGGTVIPGHEDCCRTLEVKGYTDPVMPAGKTKVYLDKYEITAGRMRAFLEAIGGGVDAAGNAKPANVKAYMGAHPPSRWNPGWENVLPADNASSQASYTVKDLTADTLYPGQDQYLINHWTQNTWWIRATGATDPAKQTPGTQGTYTVDTGVFFALGAGSMFPEYYADPSVWPPSKSEGEGYAASHALNCSNAHYAYGWSTYWFDDATVQTYGGVGKTPGSRNILDQKAMNCAPNALFAAFCAWDGGQLATAEVMDAVTDNTVSPIYDAGSEPDCQGGAACQNGKLAPGRSKTDGQNPPHALCQGNTLNTFPDGTLGCYGVFPYTTGDNDYDDSGKIAAPGRVVADVISKLPADEPWMDLIGNLQESVLKKGETQRFDYRGYGVEWSSIQHHHNQQTTPRNKGGAFGARCMRFK